MTFYLDLEDALEQVKFLGFHVKDIGLLDSALSRPKTTVFGEDAYPDLATKAASLMHSMIKNHALVDGNKRTALAACLVFLSENGLLKTNSLDVDAWETLVLDVAASVLDRHGATERLRVLVSDLV